MSRPDNLALNHYRAGEQKRDIQFGRGPVSYTHLDVYKRQGLCSEVIRFISQPAPETIFIKCPKEPVSIYQDYLGQRQARMLAEVQGRPLHKKLPFFN